MSSPGENTPTGSRFCADYDARMNVRVRAAMVMVFFGLALVGAAGGAYAQGGPPVAAATAADARYLDRRVIPGGVSSASMRADRTEERFAASEERFRQRLGREWIRHLQTARSRIGGWRRTLSAARPEHPVAVRARTLDLRAASALRDAAALRIRSVRASLAARLLRKDSTAQVRGLRRAGDLTRSSNRRRIRFAAYYRKAGQELFEAGLVSRPPER